jgi:hypothetical protein
VFVLVGFFSNQGKNALGSSQAASCDVYNVFCINDNSVRNSIHLVRIGIENCMVFCTGSEREGCALIPLKCGYSIAQWYGSAKPRGGCSKMAATGTRA